MTRQRFETSWRGIPLVVGYEPEFLAGAPHVELHVPDKRPVPLTTTGYLSQFPSAEEIAAFGGPVEYVLALLDLAAGCEAAAAMKHRFAPVPGGRPAPDVRAAEPPTVETGVDQLPLF